MNFKKMVLAAVAMVFAFSAHSGELVKKKDSFAEAAPPNFAMAHAVEGQTCHRSGDIGMSEDGLILSCQSGWWVTPNSRLDIVLRTCRGSNYVGCNPGCPSSHPNVVASQHSWPLYMMIAGINICGR